VSTLNAESMIVEVDPDLCALTGECVTVAPSVFWFEGDELKVRQPGTTEEREDADHAIDLCPMRAISWVSSA